MSGAILAQAALMRSKGLLQDDEDDHPSSFVAGNGGKTNTTRKGRRALWEYPYDPALGAEQFAHAKEHIRQLTEELKEQSTSVTLAQAVMDARKDLVDLIRTTILNDSILISDAALREEYKDRFKTILDSQELMGLHKAGLELEYRTRIERLEEEIRRNATDESAREKALESREAVMEDLRNERNAALAQVQQTKRQLTQLQEQFGVLRQNYRDANERYRENSKTASLLNSEIQAQQRIIDAQKSEIEELNMQLNEFREVLESGQGGVGGPRKSLAGFSSDATSALKRQCDGMLVSILTAPAQNPSSQKRSTSLSTTAPAPTGGATVASVAADGSTVTDRRVSGVSEKLVMAKNTDGSVGLMATPASQLPKEERLALAMSEGVAKDHRLIRSLREVVARMKPSVDKFNAETKQAIEAAVEAANEAAAQAARVVQQDQQDSQRPPTRVQPPTAHIGDVTTSLHLLLGFALEALVRSNETQAAMVKANKDAVDRYEAQIAVLASALERGASEMKQLEQMIARANPSDFGENNNMSSSTSSPNGRNTSFAGGDIESSAGGSNNGKTLSALALLSSASATLRDTIKALKTEVSDKALIMGASAFENTADSATTSSPLVAAAHADRLNRSMSVSPTRGSAGMASLSNGNSPAFDPLTPVNAWPVASEALKLALTNAEGLFSSFGLVLNTVASQQSKMQLAARRASSAKESMSAAQNAQRRRQSLFGAGGTAGIGGANDPAIELSRILMDLERRTVGAAGGANVVQSAASQQPNNTLNRSSSASSLTGDGKRRGLQRTASAIISVFNPTQIQSIVYTAQELSRDMRALVARCNDEASPKARSGGAGGKKMSDDHSASGCVPLVPQTRHIDSLSMTVLSLCKLLNTGCSAVADTMDMYEQCCQEYDALQLERDQLVEHIKRLGSVPPSPGSRRGSKAPPSLSRTNSKAALFGPEAPIAEEVATTATTNSPRRGKGGVRVFTRAVYCQTDIDATNFEIEHSRRDLDESESEEVAPPVRSSFLNTFTFGDDDAASETNKESAGEGTAKRKKGTAATKDKDKGAKAGTAAAEKPTKASPPAKTAVKTKIVSAGHATAASTAPKGTAPKVSGKKAAMGAKGPAAEALPAAFPIIDSYEAADGSVGNLPPLDAKRPTLSGSGSLGGEGARRASSVSSELMITKAQHNLLMLQARAAFEDELLAKLAERRQSVSAANLLANKRRSQSVVSIVTPAEGQPASETAAAAAEAMRVLQQGRELAAAEKERLASKLEEAEAAFESATMRANAAEKMAQAMAEDAEKAHEALVAAEERAEESADQVTLLGEKLAVLSAAAAIEKIHAGTSCGSTAQTDWHYVQTGEDLVESLVLSHPVFQQVHATALNCQHQLQRYQQQQHGSNSNNSSVHNQYPPKPILSSHSLYSYTSRPPSAKTARGQGGIAHDGSANFFSGDGITVEKLPGQLTTITPTLDLAGLASNHSHHFHSVHGGSASKHALSSNTTNPSRPSSAHMASSVASAEGGGGEGYPAHDPPLIPTTAVVLGIDARPSSPHRGLAMPATSASRPSSAISTGRSFGNRSDSPPSSRTPQDANNLSGVLSSVLAAAAAIQKTLPPLIDLYQGDKDGVLTSGSGSNSRGGGFANALGSNSSVLGGKGMVRTTSAQSAKSTRSVASSVNSPNVSTATATADVPPTTLVGAIRSQGSNTTNCLASDENTANPTLSQEDKAAMHRADVSDATNPPSLTTTPIRKVPSPTRTQGVLQTTSSPATAALLFDDTQTMAPAIVNKHKLLPQPAPTNNGLNKRPSTAASGTSADGANNWSRRVSAPNLNNTAIADVSIQSLPNRPHSSSLLSKGKLLTTGGPFARFNPDEEVEMLLSRRHGHSPQPLDTTAAPSSSTVGSAVRGSSAKGGAPRFRPASAAGAVPNARIYTVRDRGALSNLPQNSSRGSPNHHSQQQQHSTLVATLVAQYEGAVGDEELSAHVAPRPSSPPRKASELDQLDSGRSATSQLSPAAAVAGSNARGGQFYSRRLNFLRNSPDRLRSSLDKSSGGVVTMVQLGQTRSASRLSRANTNNQGATNGGEGATNGGDGASRKEEHSVVSTSESNPAARRSSPIRPDIRNTSATTKGADCFSMTRKAHV